MSDGYDVSIPAAAAVSADLVNSPALAAVLAGPAKRVTPWWYAGGAHLALVLPSGQTAVRLVVTGAPRLQNEAAVLKLAITALHDGGVAALASVLSLLTSPIPLPNGSMQQPAFVAEWDFYSPVVLK